MIIKSKTQKHSPHSKYQIDKLIQYISKDNNPLWLTHNLRCDGQDSKAVVQEFIKNNQFARKSSKQILIYHEIISFHKDDPVTSEIALDLGNEYLSRRCPDSLGYACVHKDKKHLHLHIAISGNKLNSKYQSRIATKDFSKIKKDLEAIQQERYPELTKSIVMNKDVKVDFEKSHGEKPRKDYLTKESHRKDKSIQIERRGAKPKTKKIQDMVLESLHQSRSELEFKELLKEKDLQWCVRGKRPSIKDIATNKSYRIGRSLDILDEVKKNFNKWEKAQEQQKTINNEFERLRHRRNDQRQEHQNNRRGRGVDIDFLTNNLMN